MFQRLFVRTSAFDTLLYSSHLLAELDIKVFAITHVLGYTA